MNTYLEGATKSLIGSHESLVPIPPLSESFSELDIEGAYEVQRALVRHWRASGRSTAGRKIGLTSRKMQDMLGVDQPDFGVVMQDQVFYTGASLDIKRYIAPRVEPEVAFKLKTPLQGPGCTPADVLAAVEWVAPALEVIDSRIEDWRITITDTIADNASGASVVIGEPVQPSGIDLVAMGCVLSVNGTPVASGAGGAVVGSPLIAIAWLVNTLASFGDGIEAGEIVLPGSITKAVPMTSGDVVSARFSQLGSVELLMSKEDKA